MRMGARALTPARLRAGAAAGLRGIGVSIDGLEALHDGRALPRRSATASACSSSTSRRRTA
ncbi:hypothetical protein ACTMTI_39210 [Nonomuraea sp. H19]